MPWKSPLASVTHWPLPLYRLHCVVVSAFISTSLPSLSFSFFIPSITIYLQHRPILTRRSCRPSSPFRPRSSTPDDCQSVSPSVGWRKKKAVPPSVNKCLISRLLVPACLSVCLACRQLSRRSGVAVSQVLVSVLLSVHLPVRASQIRCVNLAFFFIHGFCFFSLPFFSRFSRMGFTKQSASRKHAVFTQSSKLIVAS